MRTPITEGQKASVGAVDAIVLYGPDGQRLNLTPGGPAEYFGPGVPQRPRNPVPNFPPREYDYPQGWNLVGPRSEGGIPSFFTLRALVGWCDYARLAIDFIKKRARGAEWEFVPRDREAKTRSSRAKYSKSVDAAKAFWRTPNRIDRQGFGVWISQAVEEILVTDALTFYVWPDKAGRVHSVRQVDGATFKPLVDQLGVVTTFQQKIKGLPDVEYDLERLRYLPYNPRVNSFYGTSPVEELMPVINLAIRRLTKDITWYNDGQVPLGFITAPEDWTPANIKAFQLYMDTEWAGDAAAGRVRMIPAKSEFTDVKPRVFDQAEDESILTRVVSLFGVPRSKFISQVNRATAQTDDEQSSDLGDRPIKAFLAEFINDVTWGDLGIDDVEFVWSGVGTGKELDRSQAQSLDIASGVLTIDEARAERGLDPLTEPSEAEKPPERSEAAPGQPLDEPAATAEMEQWRRFATKPERLKRRRWADAFETRAIKPDVSARVRAALSGAQTPDEVRVIFARERAA